MQTRNLINTVSSFHVFNNMIFIKLLKYAAQNSNLHSTFPAVSRTREMVYIWPISTEYHGKFSSLEIKQLLSSSSGSKSGPVTSSGSPPPLLELESPSPPSVASETKIYGTNKTKMHINKICNARIPLYIHNLHHSELLFETNWLYCSHKFSKRQQYAQIKCKNIVLCKIKCRYNTVQFIMILHKALR